ncbi:MAG TPA: FG-GAP-like repeat-containing protein [Bryobacteraceae bacterium]|nr:FG-GAP-like repeat-containing protein [Bryobacteraceae bacterium]
MTLLKISSLAFLAMAEAAGATASSTTLQSSANPSIFGQAVTLTATVSPSAATGRITFYDGAAVVGIATLSSGKAALTTVGLSSGIRSLKAYYNGDATFQSSASTALSQRVASLGQNGFQPAVNYADGTLPRVVTVGDFNGDGRADLAAPSFGTNQVSVLLGKGDGTFQAAVAYATDLGPAQVVTGDFNADGRLDLAVCNGASASSTVSVLLGNGDGTFRPAVNYKAGANPNHLATGDFNGDGVIDIVTANFSDSTVSVLLGNGDGTFRAGIISATITGPGVVAVGDFNRDGIGDLILVNSASVAVMLGKGDGSFQPAVSYPAGQIPVYVALADFNGDGSTDLAVGNGGDDTVSILLGKPDGTFQPPVNYGAPKNIQSVAVGDFNGDGRADLAVADSGSNNVNVLLGNGDGTFQAAVPYGVGNQPTFVAVGDFNGDGRSDLAASNFVGNNVSVLLGKPSDGPHITPGGVVGAGLSAPPVRSLSANAIASVFGDTFAPDGTVKVVGPADLGNGRLPTNVSGVCVFVNNVAAPIFFLSPAQINFQVPQLPASGNVGVQVAIACNTPPYEIRTFSEPVAAVAATPEFFYFKQSPDGKNPIAAVNALNGSFIGPAGLIAGVNFVSAIPGDFVILFLTGGGTTTPAFAPGELPGGIGNVTASTVITLGGKQIAPSDFFYLGVTPGFAGLYQLNIRIPAGTPPGSQPVVLTVGGAASPAGYLFIGTSQ